MADEKGRVYTQDEVNAILSRAVTKHDPSDGLSHDELVDAARQAGIPAEAVEAAAAELEEERRAERELADVKQKSWRRFYASLVSFLIVNAFLVLVNLQTGGHFWAIWPMLGWGFGLLMHLRRILFPDLQRDRARLEKEADKRARKEAAHARRHERREERREDERARREHERALKESTRELEHAVKRGFATLLSSAAKKIHEEADRAGAPPRERTRVAGDDADARTRVADHGRADDAGRDHDDDDEDEESARGARRRGRR